MFCFETNRSIHFVWDDNNTSFWFPTALLFMCRQHPIVTHVKCPLPLHYQLHLSHLLPPKFGWNGYFSIFPCKGYKYSWDKTLHRDTLTYPRPLPSGSHPLLSTIQREQVILALRGSGRLTPMVVVSTTASRDSLDSNSLVCFIRIHLFIKLV